MTHDEFFDSFRENLSNYNFVYWDDSVCIFYPKEDKKDKKLINKILEDIEKLNLVIKELKNDFKFKLYDKELRYEFEGNDLKFYFWNVDDKTKKEQRL